jgi:hypothetical protein
LTKSSPNNGWKCQLVAQREALLDRQVHPSALWNGYRFNWHAVCFQFGMSLRRLHQPISGIPARFHKAIVTIPAGAIIEIADELHAMSTIVVLWNGRRITVCSQHVENNSEPVSVWKSEKRSNRRMILKGPDTPIDGFDPRPDQPTALLGCSPQICG